MINKLAPKYIRCPQCVDLQLQLVDAQRYIHTQSRQHAALQARCDTINQLLQQALGRLKDDAREIQTYDQLLKQERHAHQNELLAQRRENDSQIQALKEHYEAQLRLKDDQIAQLGAFSQNQDAEVAQILKRKNQEEIRARRKIEDLEFQLGMK